MFVKTGDKVRVIAGKDKGKEGTVKKTIASKDRVIVEGINMVKKHNKASQSNPQGGIVDTEAPIHVSNVMLIDPSNNEPTRVVSALKMVKKFVFQRSQIRLSIKKGGPHLNVKSFTRKIQWRNYSTYDGQIWLQVNHASS